MVGVYHGSDPEAKRLLTGSHYDTVRNGGKYDGRLGILVPMVCVRELHRAGRRLPFGLEVVGFAEEEGQRYKATFLGSGALTGHFDPAWLDQTDADGITMRDAMRSAGLLHSTTSRRCDARPAAATSASSRCTSSRGRCSTSSTCRWASSPRSTAACATSARSSAWPATPARRRWTARRDAAAAVAELALFVEQRAAARAATWSAPIGMLEVPNGSINVVPGRCRFSLDIRATTNAARDACAADVLAELERICERRGVRFTLEETDARRRRAERRRHWQRRWERAVAALGLPVHRMPSGAGHDAMKLHEVMPQAMLFVRGGNAGISHNPLESITSDDASSRARLPAPARPTRDDRSSA